MSFAYETLIAISDNSVKPIQEFLMGDVLWVAENVDLKSWVQKPIEFSCGTRPSKNMLLKICFGEPTKDLASILVTANQPFLMKNQTFKQASRLVPQVDSLISKDSKALSIISIEVGMFDIGIHNISTSDEPATNPAKHLLIANGIVAGDYSIELGLGSNPQ